MTVPRMLILFLLGISPVLMTNKEESKKQKAEVTPTNEFIDQNNRWTPEWKEYRKKALQTNRFEQEFYDAPANQHDPKKVGEFLNAKPQRASHSIIE